MQKSRSGEGEVALTLKAKKASLRWPFYVEAYRNYERFHFNNQPTGPDRANITKILHRKAGGSRAISTYTRTTTKLSLIHI